MSKFVVVNFLSLLVINLVEAEEETCRKGDPGCASEPHQQHDKYSKEANVDKFEVH